MRRLLPYLLSSALILAADNVSSADTNPPPGHIEILPSDRILIFAPHPDDEIIACGGLIQQAMEAGAEVRVLYLTEGEHNVISLIFYEKKVLFKKKHEKFIKLGVIRRNESTNAAVIAGLDKSDLVFLDYPDSGTRLIFAEHWGKGREYTDSLTGLSHARKGEGIKPYSPYTADSILNDIEKTIKKFRPTKIFCSHPMDRHSDHIALYLFMKAALLELGDIEPEPEVYLYIVHYPRWPSPRRFRPELPLTAPQGLRGENLKWVSLKLTPRQIERKKQALMQFRTQLQYNQHYLLSFDRRNELFSEDLKRLSLRNAGRIEINEKNRTISWVFDKGLLKIGVKFPRQAFNKKGLRGALYLLGFRKDRRFKDMPKIKVGFRYGSYKVYDNGKKITKDGIVFKVGNNKISFSIPLAILGNPDLLLSSHKINLYGSNIEKWGNWRLIELK